MNSTENDNDLRLQVFLSRSGAASRRHAAEIIEGKRVRVNGKVIEDPGYRVTDTDKVTLDGKGLHLVKQAIFVALHKPVQYLCSLSDPQNRPLAIDLLKPFFTQRLFHVGRLDYLSSGLILFTNDGEWAKNLMHPSSELEKEYEIVTKKEVPLSLLERFTKGIMIEGVFYKCKSFFQKGPRSINVVLTEGKNREIRTVFQNSNIPVKRVHRIRIGSVSLKGLAPGRHRELTPREIKSLSLIPDKNELKKNPDSKNIKGKIANPRPKQKIVRNKPLSEKKASQGQKKTPVPKGKPSGRRN